MQKDRANVRTQRQVSVSLSFFPRDPEILTVGACVLDHTVQYRSCPAFFFFFAQRIWLDSAFCLNHSYFKDLSSF